MTPALPVTPVALPEAEARKSPCSRCHAGPLEDCHPPDVLHLERYLCAWREDRLGDAGLRLVLEAIVTFTLESAVPAGVLQQERTAA